MGAYPLIKSEDFGHLNRLRALSSASARGGSAFG
jgi:hypothetical protein